MGKLIDLTNQQFGELLVIERGVNDNQNKPQWICKCSCGETCLIRGSLLRSGKTTTCPTCGKKKAGTSRTKEKDLEILNTKFGFLTPIRIDDTKERGAGKPKYWLCECDCGNMVSLTSHQLLKNLQITCGMGCKYHNQNLSDIKTEDLSNQKFGKLTVIERSFDKITSTKNRSSQWKCKCDCGNIIIASRTSLIKGSRQCCNICLGGKSIGEKNIEVILRNNNITFQTEVSFSDLRGVNNGAVRFDFVIYEDNAIQRIVEFDGEFHYIENNLWNSEIVKQNDIIKTNYCKEKRIPLVRIPYWERDNIILEMIMGDKYLCEIEK